MFGFIMIFAFMVGMGMYDHYMKIAAFVAYLMGSFFGKYRIHFALCITLGYLWSLQCLETLMGELVILMKEFIDWYEAQYANTTVLEN